MNIPSASSHLSSSTLCIGYHQFGSRLPRRCADAAGQNGIGYEAKKVPRTYFIVIFPHLKILIHRPANTFSASRRRKGVRNLFHCHLPHLRFLTPFPAPDTFSSIERQRRLCNLTFHHKNRLPVIPVHAGTHAIGESQTWIPACAEMTVGVGAHYCVPYHLAHAFTANTNMM